MKSTRKFVFNLKVEIPVGTSLASLEKDEPSIHFELDANPSNELMHPDDDILHKDFIIQTMRFIEGYINRIDTHVSNMVIAKKAKPEQLAKLKRVVKNGPSQDLSADVVQINRAKLQIMHLDKNEIYHLSTERISRIVYRKNSPMLGNVMFVASSNGDVQPPGTKRP